MSLLEGELHMRKILMAMTIIVLASLSMVGTAQAQDVVVGTVVSDPAMVPAAGEYTMTATGSDFIPDTAVLLVACVSPADALVPGVSDLAEIVAAANAISPLADCDLAAAQNVEVDGNGGWTAVLTADVGDNFFLSAGALDGSQKGATWIAIVPSSGLPNTGAETGLLAIVGTAVLGAGVLVAGVSRRVRR
jgi:LPXTG-motif cell wall-anchored protein